MAETILLSVFGMLASPVISKLVTNITSSLDQTDNANDLAEHLEDLKTTIMPQLELTILAVKHRPPDKIAPLAEWLVNLKNAYIDAAHILHEVMNSIVKKRALMSLGNDKEKKLLKRLKRLKKVAAQTKTFRELLGKANYSRSVTSGHRTYPVFGREGDRNEIIDFLLDGQGGSSSSVSYLLDGQGGSSSGERYSVVVITGMEGAGKTTLAQYVYNNERIKGHFVLTMWLSLLGNMDITKATKEMIECASKKECPNINNLHVLQNKLIATLPESGNIMVVLDDVWYDGDAAEQQWSGLLEPFAFRKGTCKIVVTSRSPLILPHNLRGKYIKLSDLAPDDFISFLRYRTMNGLPINPESKNDFGNIVNHIAKKMSKMSIQPLEAEVVGNQLYHKPNITYWEEAQKVVDEFEKFVDFFKI